MSNQTSTQPAVTHCPDCRAMVEEIDGQWGPYLIDVSRAYSNGQRYNRGAHHCAPGVAERAEQTRREESAFIEARMVADYFDDFGGVHPDDH